MKMLRRNDSRPHYKISGNLRYSKFLPMKGDPGYFTKSGSTSPNPQ